RRIKSNAPDIPIKLSNDCLIKFLCYATADTADTEEKRLSGKPLFSFFLCVCGVCGGYFFCPKVCCSDLGIVTARRPDAWSAAIRVRIRLRDDVSLAAQSFQKGDACRSVDQHEVIGYRQRPELDLQTFAGPTNDRGPVQSQLAQEGQPEPFDGAACHTAGDERRDQQ